MGRVAVVVLPHSQSGILALVAYPYPHRFHTVRSRWRCYYKFEGCTAPSIFIETLSLGRLPTKTKDPNLTMRHCYLIQGSYVRQGSCVQGGRHWLSIWYHKSWTKKIKVIPPLEKEKNRKCSEEEIMFIMGCYFLNNPSRLGCLIRMLELWNSKGLLLITKDRLVDQTNNIRKGCWFELKQSWKR